VCALRRDSATRGIHKRASASASARRSHGSTQATGAPACALYRWRQRSNSTLQASRADTSAAASGSSSRQRWAFHSRALRPDYAVDRPDAGSCARGVPMGSATAQDPVTHDPATVRGRSGTPDHPRRPHEFPLDGSKYCGIQPAHISLSHRRSYWLRRLQGIPRNAYVTAPCPLRS